MRRSKRKTSHLCPQQIQILQRDYEVGRGEERRGGEKSRAEKRRAEKRRAEKRREEKTREEKKIDSRLLHVKMRNNMKKGRTDSCDA